MRQSLQVIQSIGQVLRLLFYSNMDKVRLSFAYRL